MKIVDLDHDGRLRSKWIEYIGGEYNFIEKIRQNGVGSPRMIYRKGIERFDAVSECSNDTNYINIEQFKNGIAIRLKKEDLFICAVVPKDKIEQIVFETFKIKVYYKGQEVIKKAARIYLDVEAHRVDFLLSAAFYKSGRAFFSKHFFCNKVEFSESALASVDENVGEFDAGIFELLRLI